MTSYKIAIALVLFSTTMARGQSASLLIGGRSTGLGSCSASLKDNWALYNNPAGSAKLDDISFNSTYDKCPSLPGADRIAAALVMPTRAGTFSVGVFKFGDELYSEQLASAGYSHSLGLASMGVRIDIIQYRTEGYEPAVAMGVSAGTVADITETLALGCYVSNVNRPTLPDGSPLPIRMAAGFAFHPTGKVLVCGELEKDIDYSPTFKGGIEVSPFRKVKLRSGFNLYPNAAYGGFGITSRHMVFDYSLSYRPSLAYAHQVSLSFKARGKEKKK